MFYVMTFIIAFIIIYFVYYFIFDDMLKKEKYTKISELVLLTKKFNLDKKKMDYRSTLNGVAIINAFIMSFTMAFVLWVPIPDLFKLVVAFIIIMLLLVSLYMMYGKMLSKKWGKK